MSQRHDPLTPASLQAYPWGGLEEDEPGEQYFQNLPTSSASVTPAAPPPCAAAGDPNPGKPVCTLAPPSPPSPSPSPHLSNTDAMGEGDTLKSTKVWPWNPWLLLLTTANILAPTWSCVLSWQVHGPHQLHLHLHNVPHPASDRWANKSDPKVRSKSPSYFESTRRFSL